MHLYTRKTTEHEQRCVCESVKERGEDLLHESYLEGPALAVGDCVLP